VLENWSIETIVLKFQKILLGPSLQYSITPIVKNPGPQDLVLLLPPERGLYNILCNSASCWSNGVLE
jgi:hypothetical protein